MPTWCSSPGLAAVGYSGLNSPQRFDAEHYTLGMQRAATISEVNGRASIFIGAVSAGLIALGFEGAGSRPADP